MKSSALQKHVYEGEQGKSCCMDSVARVQKTRRFFSELPASKVLDVGCGDGAILAPFAGKHDLHGVDVAQGAVDAAKAAGMKAVQHDLENPLPFPNDTFDLVFCGETIEHQIDTDWLLSEINRVLRPGGLLVLTYPNVRTPVGILMLAFLDMPPMYAARYRAPHYRDFTLKTIKIALGNNAFSFVRATGCSFFLPKIGECFKDMASFLPSLASTVIVQARKIGPANYRPEDSISEIY
jgi:SAM-dependent methyltransferase